MEYDKIVLSKYALQMKELLDVAILKEQLTHLIGVNTLLKEDKKVAIDHKKE